MTTWEERVAHLSERWATSSRPHRNPPPHTVIPAKAGNHAPPPSSSATSPTANQPNPKNHPNQTNHSRGSPCGCPRAPQPAIPPTRPTPVFPAKAGNHATPNPQGHQAHSSLTATPTLPSFRRKPETTQPQLPGTARQHQPNCNSHPSRLSGESRNPRNPNSPRTPGPLQPNGNSHASRHSNEIRNESRAKSGKNDVAHLPRGGQLVLPHSSSRQ